MISMLSALIQYSLPTFKNRMIAPLYFSKQRQKAGGSIEYSNFDSLA